MYVIGEMLPDLSGAGDGTYSRKPLDELLTTPAEKERATTLFNLFAGSDSSDDEGEGAREEDDSSSMRSEGSAPSPSTSSSRRKLFKDANTRQALLAKALTSCFHVVLLLRSSGANISTGDPLAEIEDVGLHMFASLSLGSGAGATEGGRQAAKAAAMAAARSGRTLRTGWTASRVQLEHALLVFFRMFEVRFVGVLWMGGAWLCGAVLDGAVLAGWTRLIRGWLGGDVLGMKRSPLVLLIWCSCCWLPVVHAHAVAFS